MKTEVRLIPISEILKGFEYDELEEKGLLGMDGKLIIQPPYQRNYVYNDDKGRDREVVKTVLRGGPIGLIYLRKREDGMLEILDGQQRITSLGRFALHKFSVSLGDDSCWYFDMNNPESSSLPNKYIEAFQNTKLLIEVVEGAEAEIMDWFKTANTQGVPLTDQELLNAMYSGPLVDSLRGEFSNKNNSMVQKRRLLMRGDLKRQHYLRLLFLGIVKARRIFLIL